MHMSWILIKGEGDGDDSQLAAKPETTVCDPSFLISHLYIFVAKPDFKNSHSKYESYLLFADTNMYILDLDFGFEWEPGKIS